MTHGPVTSGGQSSELHIVTRCCGLIYGMIASINKWALQTLSKAAQWAVNEQASPNTSADSGFAVKPISGASRCDLKLKVSVTHCRAAVP